MNGGMSQEARILRHVDDHYRDGLEAFNRATHPDAVRELQLVPAEEAKPEYDPPIGDALGLIRSIGWRRIVGAAARSSLPQAAGGGIPSPSSGASGAAPLDPAADDTGPQPGAVGGLFLHHRRSTDQ